MKQRTYIRTSLTIVVVLACVSITPVASAQTTSLEGTLATLYDTIVYMDSIWEDSYNNCRIDKQEELISEDLEFYHDRGRSDDIKESIDRSFEKEYMWKSNARATGRKYRSISCSRLWRS